MLFEPAQVARWQFCTRIVRSGLSLLLLIATLLASGCIHSDGSNSVPVIVSPGDQVSAEGATVALPIDASDPDEDSLEYSATGLPPDLTIDASTGEISGTLTNTAATGSPYAVSVTVSDEIVSSSVDFTWSVTNPAPVMVSPGDQSSIEGATVALPIDASDPDGDSLVYSATGLPPDLTINPSTGLISGTIGSTAAGGSPYSVIAEVSDGVASSQIAFTWVVNPVLPQISISDQTVLESNSSGAVFIVSLSAVTGYTVTVEYATADGSAVAGQDYQAASGQLTFSPGVTTQQLTVPLLDDASDESSETFLVNLSNAVNGDIADAQAVGTIQDDDAAPELSINNVTVAEGNSGTTAAVFTVSLSATSGRTVSVDFATANGTAQAGQDYQAASGTLVVAPGTLTQTLTVLVNGDAQLEPDETYFVNLSNAANAQIADSQGVGAITNDDAVPQLSINDVTVTEGNTGTTSAEFTVTLSAISGQTVTVNFATAGNTATSGQDFIAISGTLTFSPGTTTQTLSVAIVGDQQLEPDETFLVNLSGAVNADVADAQGIGTISNDDVGPLLSINDVMVTEGNAGSTPAEFTVTLSPTTSQQVTVNFATAGNTAMPGQDFTVTNGTLTFAPGTATQTLTVMVIGDAQSEPDETFFVNLSNAVNAQIVDGQGVGTITNDDTTVLITSQMTGEILRYSAETGAFRDVLVGDDSATPYRDESGGLVSPGHLLLDPDHQLYVASQITDEILLYDAETGAFLDVLVGDDPATPDRDESGGVVSPGHLMSDSDGHLYVASQMTDEILLYDAETGAFLGVLVGDDPATQHLDESGGLRGLTSMAFGPDGELYVSSLQTNQILRYDATTGDFLDVLVGDDPETPGIDESAGLQGPSSIVCDADGQLYVSSLHTNEVLRYDGRTGAFIDTFVPASSGGLLAPEQLIFGPKGHLFVSSAHGQQILCYDGLTGAFLDVSVDLAASHGEMSDPMNFIFMQSIDETR